MASTRKGKANSAKSIRNEPIFSRKLNEQHRKRLRDIHAEVLRQLEQISDVLREAFDLEPDFVVTSVETSGKAESRRRVGMRLGFIRGGASEGGDSEVLCFCDPPGVCIACSEMSGGRICTDIYPPTR